MKNRIAALTTVLLLTLGGSAVMASPAYAAWGGCSGIPQRVCTYWDANGEGAVYYYTGPFNQCIDIGEPWEDDISSVWNRFTGWKVRFWNISDTCSGGLYVNVSPGSKNSYGGSLDNDSFSSLKIVPA